jgi:NADPH:quinone reductase-like Zn-dependent oxidoreductase
MFANGTLQTTIAARFQLSDVVAAHEMVAAAQHIGIVIVDIA